MVKKSYKIFTRLPGHSFSKQEVVISVSPEQIFPPFEASVERERLRVVKPMPQLALHFDQTDHWFQAQSIRAKIKETIQ